MDAKYFSLLIKHPEIKSKLFLEISLRSHLLDKSGYIVHRLCNPIVLISMLSQLEFTIGLEIYSN